MSPPPRLKHPSPRLARLNALPWTDHLTFTSYGLPLAIRADDPQAFAALLDRLPPGWQPTDAPVVRRIFSLLLGGPDRPRPEHEVYANGALVARTPELDQALDLLESALHLYVAEFARDFVFVHAGVVGWRGRAILLPGRSFAGKSTLVAALVRAGADYYSDEYAVLDPSGLVHPFPRPLRLRQPSGAWRVRYTAAQLGAPPAAPPLPVGLVLVTAHRPRARWRPRPLSPTAAILALLANAVPARRRPAAVLETLRAAIAPATALQTDRPAASTVVPQILTAATPPAPCQQRDPPPASGEPSYNRIG